MTCDTNTRCIVSEITSQEISQRERERQTTTFLSNIISYPCMIMSKWYPLYYYRYQNQNQHSFVLHGRTNVT